MSWKLLVIAAALLATAAVHAADNCQLARYAELPVTMSDKQPTVRGSINGVEGVFLADSGAFYSLLYPESVSKFKLKRQAAPWGLSVVGVGGAESVNLAVAKDFVLDGFRNNNVFHKVQFLVLSRAASDGLDGIIGQNVLGHADTEWDLGNGVVRLFHSQECENRSLAYWSQATPFAVLEIERPTPMAPHVIGTATLNGKPIRVMFDSGCERSMLSLKAARQAGFDQNAQGVVSGGEVSGIGRRTVTTWIGTFDELALDSEKIKHARLRVGEGDNLDVDMVLGADFFLSHRLYVAPDQRRIYFTYNGGRVFDLSVTTPAAQALAAPSATTPNITAESAMDVDQLKRRAAAFMAREDYRQAIIHFDQALQLDPMDADMLAQRGLAHLHAGDRQLALHDLDEALKAKPTHIDARRLRITLRLDEEDESGARADLEVLMQITANDAAMSLDVIGIYTDAGFHEDAVKQVGSWIEKHPDADEMPTALNLRCWTRALMGKELEAALADCNAALKQSSREPAYLDSRGLVWIRLGDYKNAIKDYSVVIKQQPDNAWSLYGLGLSEARAGLTAQGEKHRQAAIALDPAVIQGYAAIGLAP